MTRLANLEKKALAKRDGRERAKDLLRLKDLNVKTAAAAIGEAAETVSRVLGGEETPRADRILNKLAKVLGLTRAELNEALGRT